MFIDRVILQIKAGNGGDGITSFLHFKGVVNGGPDGGDGGRGGDVIFMGDRHANSLSEYYYKNKFSAGNGERGGPKNCFGKDGDALVLRVPLGTVIRDAESGGVIADIFEDGQKVTVLKGGEGGRGNARFATSRRHAPHFSQTGEKTETHSVILELKTIADVGLVGFPNVGKSTLLSKITKARPKIADYHFTTLSPNLGVCEVYGEKFVVADIPGLIEGASDGAGLGIEFLRHIERTRMLVHVVDISESEGRNAYEDFKKINAELKNYSPLLAKKKQIVALNKCDAYGAEGKGGGVLRKTRKKIQGGEDLRDPRGSGRSFKRDQKGAGQAAPRAAGGIRSVHLRKARKTGIYHPQGIGRGVRHRRHAGGCAFAQRGAHRSAFDGVSA